jgi:hypothetical protein
LQLVETYGEEARMSISLVKWVAVVAAAISILQMLLAARLPLGHAAFDGDNQVLPRTIRLVSAVTVLVFFAAL